MELPTSILSCSPISDQGNKKSKETGVSALHNTTAQSRTRQLGKDPNKPQETRSPSSTVKANWKSCHSNDPSQQTHLPLPGPDTLVQKRSGYIVMVDTGSPILATVSCSHYGITWACASQIESTSPSSPASGNQVWEEQNNMVEATTISPLPNLIFHLPALPINPFPTTVPSPILLSARREATLSGGCRPQASMLTTCALWHICNSVHAHSISAK